jgi:hypothetical protein
MNSRRFRSLLVLAACLTVCSIQVRASGPISVYAIVEKVVLEPNDQAPERVQLWGVFSVVTPGDSGTYGQVYSKPERGYLYFKASEDGLARDVAAWADLKKVAGTGQAIGFGGRARSRFSDELAGRVRRATEKPKSPDTYPSGNPVVLLGAAQTSIVAQLKAALDAR